MATLTPQGETASSHRAGSIRHSRAAHTRVRRRSSSTALASLHAGPAADQLSPVSLCRTAGHRRGWMMVLSASRVNAYLTVGDSYVYVKRQLIFLAVGVLGVFAIMKLPPSTLRMLSWFGVALAAILLILTYTPLGISVNGNRNWLYLGSETFSIQPAEFAKLAMIVWGADLLARKQRVLDRPKHLLVPFLPVSAVLICSCSSRRQRGRR